MSENELTRKIESLGINLNDRECPIVNAICPYRKNYTCKFTRLQRLALGLDCALE